MSNNIENLILESQLEMIRGFLLEETLNHINLFKDLYKAATNKKDRNFYKIQIELAKERLEIYKLSIEGEDI